MTARLIAFPGVTLTAREIEASEPPPKPVTTAPCPVCGYRIRSNDVYEIERCERCQRDLHSACYWRQLPIEEWLHYIRWMEEQSDEDFQAGNPFDRETICAACRQRDGRGTEEG